MKVCTKCKIEKPFDCFTKYLKSKNGLKNWCISCCKEYYLLNKEKIDKRNKQHYESNKEKINEKNKQYKKLNKEKIAIQQKEYQELNKEKIAKYRELNKEKLAEYHKQYQNEKFKTDMVFKFKCNVRNNICSSFKRGTNQFRKNASTETILGCTIEEFRLYIQSQFKKGMTFKNYGDWHLDHIIPLSTATTEEEIIKLNHYTNFQPLWAKENISKSYKIIEKQLKLI